MGMGTGMSSLTLWKPIPVGWVHGFSWVCMWVQCQPFNCDQCACRSLLSLSHAHLHVLVVDPWVAMSLLWTVDLVMSSGTRNPCPHLGMLHGSAALQGFATRWIGAGACVVWCSETGSRWWEARLFG